MFDLTLLAQEALPENTWAQFINRMDGSHAFVIMIVSLACLTAIVITSITSLSAAFRSWRNVRERSRLVQSMLDRGLAPDEISQLVALTHESESKAKHRSATQTPPRAANVPPAKPIITPR